MAGDDKLHIVVFPWLAMGHLTPFLELTKLIVQKGHLVSYVSTPKNIDRLPKLPPKVAAVINFVKLPLPKVDKLPGDAEATVDVPYKLVPLLKKAYDGLQEPLARFLESSKPDWIIYDFAPYWVGPIASKLGIKSAYFSTFNAAAMGFFGSVSEMMGTNPTRKSLEALTAPPPWFPFPSTVAFSKYHLLRFSDCICENDSGVSDGYRAGASVQNCDIVVVRSCSEFEPEYIQVLENLYQKPVLPVGQLPNTANDDGDENDKWRGIKDWLDKQKKGTVVYAAFGSEAKLTQEQVTKIAHGLEKSELPFFWVLRLRSGPTDTEVLKLPEGFEERTRGRGVVWNSWAPQLKILGHESVGGFLTHGGWSSVVEGTQNAKPLLLLTFQLDQGLNARLLEDKKMGYAIPRDKGDGSFTSESVAKSLRLVVVEEEGRVYREKIKEMKDLFANRERQDRYVDQLLGYVKDHRNPKRVQNGAA